MNLNPVSDITDNRVPHSWHASHIGGLNSRCIVVGGVYTISLVALEGCTTSITAILACQNSIRFQPMRVYLHTLTHSQLQQCEQKYMRVMNVPTLYLEIESLSAFWKKDSWADCEWEKKHGWTCCEKHIGLVQAVKHSPNTSHLPHSQGICHPQLWPIHGHLELAVNSKNKLYSQP